MFEKLKSEGRIFSTDWNDYDSIHAVFEPKNMGRTELEDLLAQVSNECYTLKRIFKRTVGNRRGGILKLAVNIGFRIYNKKTEKTLRKERTKKR